MNLFLFSYEDGSLPPRFVAVPPSSVTAGEVAQRQQDFMANQFFALQGPVATPTPCQCVMTPEEASLEDERCALFALGQ